MANLINFKPWSNELLSFLTTTLRNHSAPNSFALSNTYPKLFRSLSEIMATHLKFWFVRRISILARNFLFPFRKNPMSDEPWQLVLQQLNYKLWWSLVVQIVWPLVFHHLFLHSTRDPTNMPKGVYAEMLCIFQNEDIVGASLIQRTL